MYVVDFRKSAHELLLGLINFENKDNPDWEPILPEDVILIQPPTALPASSPKNTKTTIRTKKDEFTVRDVDVFYNRISIDILFSAVGLFVQELNIDKIGETGFAMNSKVFDEINRKYGVNFGPDDFALFRDGDRYVIRAEDKSLVFIGRRDINIIPSLATRVATTALDGFFVVSYDNVWVLSFTEAYPVSSVYSTNTPFVNPNQTIGGVWERLPVHNLTSDEAYFMNLPLRYVVSLNEPPVRRQDGAYVMIELGRDSTYNEGYAVATEDGWEITYEDSPEFGNIAPYGPKGSYILIYRAEGEVNTGSAVYRWSRVE